MDGWMDDLIEGCIDGSISREHQDNWRCECQACVGRLMTYPLPRFRARRARSRPYPPAPVGHGTGQIHRGGRPHVLLVSSISRRDDTELMRGTAKGAGGRCAIQLQSCRHEAFCLVYPRATSSLDRKKKRAQTLSWTHIN
jgi:hypothetical protein